MLKVEPSVKVTRSVYAPSVLLAMKKPEVVNSLVFRATAMSGLFSLMDEREKERAAQQLVLDTLSDNMKGLR
jgi:hypothetical protein